MVETKYREPLVLSEAINSIEVFVRYFEWDIYIYKIYKIYICIYIYNYIYIYIYIYMHIYIFLSFYN